MKKMDFERQLKIYKESLHIEPDREKIICVADGAKRVYFESAQQQVVSYFEFIYQQTRYIKKRWWLAQLLILCFVWWLILVTNDISVIKIYLGVLSPAFVIMIVPELWKNQSYNAVEVEICAYFSLRQIYTARLLAFAVVDCVLLGAFIGSLSFTVSLALHELMVEFLLPMTVTCCICLKTLCSRFFSSEIAAVCMSMLWVMVWCVVIHSDKIYRSITMPIWVGVYCLALAYLVFLIRRVLKDCESRWEDVWEWN